MLVAGIVNNNLLIIINFKNALFHPCTLLYLCSADIALNKIVIYS